MIRTFIQVASLVFTLEAAIFLAKGNLGLSAKVIFELASTNWDINSGLIDSLSQQRADAWIGVVLLLVAFVMQMINSLWPMSWVDFAVHKGAAIYAVVLCVVIGFGALFLSKYIAQNTTADVKVLLSQQEGSG